MLTAAENFRKPAKKFKEKEPYEYEIIHSRHPRREPNLQVILFRY